MKIIINGKKNNSEAQDVFEFDDDVFSVEYIESDSGILTIRDTTGVSSYLDIFWKEIKKYEYPFTASVYYFSDPLVVNVTERTLVYQKEKSEGGITVDFIRAVKLYI